MAPIILLDVEANADAPLSEEESARLLNLFKSYEGTHFFHNFADGKIAHTDGQARRLYDGAHAGRASSPSGSRCCLLSSPRTELHAPPDPQDDRDGVRCLSWHRAL